MVNYILQEKIEQSYKILKLAAEMSKEYYKKPLIITYSGGKDSDVIVQLAIECLEPNDFEVLNSHTTLDAPETVYYIRDKFKELNELGIKTTIQYPRKKDGSFNSIWRMIEEKQIPPTRLARYCCAELKETSTPNRFIATGVRSEESAGRRNRDYFATRGRTKKKSNYYSYDHTLEVFEDDKARRNEGGVEANEIGVYDCYLITQAKQNKDLICNPIYKWIHREVWEFIEDRKMKYNPLYDKGFTRVGCIGCPLASNQVIELEMYPKYKQNFINAFERMLKRRREAGKNDLTDKSGLHKWDSGEAVYKWWVNDTSIEGQTTIYDFLGDKNNE